jgi:predicted RNA-binding protein with PIN domain
MSAAHPPGVPLPDALLGPLVEEAADTLRALESVDVPNSLRHLHGFDRRGLLAGPGRRQLRRAIERDAAFRERVVARFTGRDAVQALLAGWTVAEAASSVEAAGARRDLPLLASALWAARPPGAEFALGLIAARADAHREAEQRDEARRDEARERAALEEARRRADAARLEAEAEAARVAEQLNKERRERRAREEEADARVTAARTELARVTAQLDAANEALAAEATATARALKRARALDEELGRVRAQLDRVRTQLDRTRRASPGDATPLGERDRRTIAQAADAAERIAAALRGVEQRAVAPAPAPPAPAAPARLPAPATRASPDVPPGVLADSPPGIEAMLRTPGMLLVVDGYNVTKRAWPEASAAEQRERLGVATTGLHRRIGCRVLIVFDGDGTGGARPELRRGGVRVVFSDAGEEADDVIVREVSDLPKRIPVVVASSDGWVRAHAEAQGAVVVGADAFLRFLRPGR